MTAVDDTTYCRLLPSSRDAERFDLRRHLAVYGAVPSVGRRDGSSERLIASVEASGLKGRGGAAFPTGRKLRSARDSRCATVVVNAMEGEPESSKDAVLLRCSPHLVLDGAEMVVAALGAAHVVVCVPEDRPHMFASVNTAIAERRSWARSKISIEIRRMPAGFVAGEESALVSGLAGRRPVPTFRTDKAVPLRLGRRPVLVHNSETLANVALVARFGPDWFRSVGTPDSPGSTLVTVSGAVSQPGVHEVPFGMPIREILRLSGPYGEPMAVLVGGYGGAWAGESELDSPYTHSTVGALGASIGPGILMVLPRGSCAVAETARIAHYLASQSAGQCGPCVYGLPSIASDLVSLAEGRADAKVVERLRQRCEAVTGRGACRHPDGVARMVASALRVFDDEVRSHLARHPCPGFLSGSVLAVMSRARSGAR